MDIKKNIEDNKDLIVAGAGIAALAVTAYFLTGPKGRKNQRQLKGWMVKMKGDVIERLEDIRDVTEPVYNEVVDTVAQAQMVSSRIPRREILELAEDLKRDWEMITLLAKGDKPVTPKRKPKSKKSSKKVSSKTSTKKKSNK